MFFMWIQACEGQTVCLRRRFHESDGQFSQSGPAWPPGICKETCSAPAQQRLGADGCFSSWLWLPVTVMVQEAAGTNCSFTGVSCGSLRRQSLFIKKLKPTAELFKVDSNMKFVSAAMTDSSHIDLRRVSIQDRDWCL